MTAFSWLASGAVLAVLLPLCSALNLTVPDTIQAGVPTEVTVEFDFWKQRYEYMDDGAFDVKPVCYNPPEDGCSTDALYQHYRIYLFNEQWMYICYLSDLIPIGTTNPNVTIPVDLGPPGTYDLSAIEFNGTVMYMNHDTVAGSNDFTLEGTNVSSWTLWEKYGGWVKPYNELPCSAYACFRACGLRYSDGRGNNINGTTQELFDCWNACPGLQADPTQADSLWNWYAHPGAGHSSLTAPAGATTPPAATNVIPVTLVGPAYPSGAAAEGPTELPTAMTTTRGGLAAATGTKSGAVTASPTKASRAAAGWRVPAWSWSVSVLLPGLMVGTLSL